MPKCITYSVKWYPAIIRKPAGGFASFEFQPFDPRMTRHTIATDSLATLQAGVRDIARESKQDSCMMISLPRGERKPRGFDAACSAVNWIQYEESV